MDTIKQKIEYWLSENFDEQTRSEVNHLLNNNEQQLMDSFYKDLEFGTGGMRGIMGVGTNRMNKYTIGMTTQGLSNYLLKQFPNTQIKCAIAFDSRNNSKYFAEITASVFSANGIKVFLFDTLRPTPELSFTIRHLECHSGVVITASHNPKEYNGYKVYWKDGGQIVMPHDKGIIEEVRKVKDVNSIKFDDNLQNVQIVGKEIDDIYIQKLSELCLNPEIIRNTDLKIVFTPLHGATVNLVPMGLRKLGFNNIHIVEEQAIPDGNFPTVESPNPEESSAFNIAITKAKSLDADIIMGCDPDGDRLGIVIKNKNNDFVLFNGNQTASILVYYLLDQSQKKSKLTGNDYIVKTIVTSELISEIAAHYKVKCFDVLTGFKYIAEIIEKHYGTLKFIGGGEESYGFLSADFVRDKDAVMTCMLIAEIASWAKHQGKTLYDILMEIYIKFGYYLEDMKSLTKKGKSGLEEITTMMEKFRNQPPQSILGIDIALIHDFQKQQTIDMISDLRYEIMLPKSNVLQYDLIDGTKITIRPSGTEPKIKFYVSVHEKILSVQDFETTTKQQQEKINKIFDYLS